jgi:nucleoside-diphosphate-sugar epimerase
MVHILGSNGYLGKKLTSILSENNINFLKYSSKVDTTSKFFDLGIMNSASLNYIQKDDIVFFLSAISSPDVCEKNFDYAKKINYDATTYYIQDIISKKAHVFFMSSDVVYGNSNILNDELSSVNPFGNYAYLKHQIELEFSSSRYFHVLRLSYVYSQFDRFYLYLLDCLLNNKIAEVYSGLYRNAVYISDLLDLFLLVSQIKDLNVMKEFPKLINVVGEELLSREDMANYFKSKYKEIQLKVVKTPESILSNRPEKILTKSLFFNKLLKKPTTSYENFILKGDL